MAWGDRYIEDLLLITLPALLAPGNLPTLVTHFDCEFVLVTETRLFERITCAPVVQRLLQHCDVRLVPIDDLLSPWYGITLTYALVRAFADLGPAMVDTHLIFLNADFIVADGSYANLVEMIDRGERLVVSPSYCMVLEHTIGKLRERFDPSSCSISVPPRELAALIIANRHNTIRAKTANQQLFRIHRYDQFYWYVDDRTLLCRQMPIALVYMRPERVLTALPTFWDYGVISEFCPTLRPCVLGDSDHFLMAELRTESTFSELLHLGWPSVHEIAEDLSSYVTKDHHDYGRHTLVLHSDDLPPILTDEQANFEQFVESVYAELRPPISYIDHHFWAAAFPRFLASNQLKQRDARRASEAEAALRLDPEFARVEALRRRRKALEGRLQRVALKIAVQDVAFSTRRTELENAFRRELQTLTHDGLRLNEARRLLLEERASVDREFARLLKERHQNPRWLLESPGQSAPTSVRSPTAGAAIAPIASGSRLLALAAKLYQALFGILPDTTPWHPYHHMLVHVNAALRTLDTPQHIALIISSGGAVGATLTRHLAGEKVQLTAQMVLSETYGSLFDRSRRFGLCFCDLAFDDLECFRDLLDKIRPLLAPGAKLVLFHQNTELRSLDQHVFRFTKVLFPLIGRSRVCFTGSRLGALATRWFTRLLHRVNLSKPTGVIAGAVVMAICALPARLASRQERSRSPCALPIRCTSMLIEITHLL
jgi:hypothetical protein